MRRLRRQRDEIEAARKQGAAKAQQQANIRQIQKELKDLKKGTSPQGAAAAAAAGTSPRPGGLNQQQLGQLRRVRLGQLSHDLWLRRQRPAGLPRRNRRRHGAKVYAYSPTTGQTYSMYCTAGSPHECAGSNEAVYFP